MSCLVVPAPLAADWAMWCIYRVNRPRQKRPQLNPPTREPAVSGRGGQHPSIREGTGDTLEPHSDLQELDLIHHPSYQERSGSNKTSRRRRRRDTPAPSRSGGRAENDGQSQKEQPQKEPSPKEPPQKESPQPKETSEATSASSQPSRSRSNGRRDKKTASPPEVVAVEMTPDEQRIYAMMGVSPLVLSQQPVNDPKNAVVSVVMPGESDRAGTTNGGTASTATASTATQEAPKLAQSGSETVSEEDSPDAKASENRSTAQEQPVSAQNAAAVAAESAPEAADASEAIAAPPSDEESKAEETDVRRRRRRRSSSSSDQTSSASTSNAS